MTRLLVAQAAKQNLEAEIAELHAEIVSLSPPADSEVPPSEISLPSLAHQAHDRSGSARHGHPSTWNCTAAPPATTDDGIPCRLLAIDRATAFRHSFTRSPPDIRPTLKDGHPRPLQSRGQ